MFSSTGKCSAATWSGESAQLPARVAAATRLCTVKRRSETRRWANRETFEGDVATGGWRQAACPEYLQDLLECWRTPSSGVFARNTSEKEETIQ